MTLKLGILCSHPIQYNAPLFRELATRLDLKVFYAHRQTAAGQAAAGFGVGFDWDTDLFSGYAHEFLPNHARHPGVDRFMGCDTPEVADKIRDGRFDAFLVTGWYLRSYWQAIRACRRQGVPVMVRGDSRLGTARGGVKRLVKRLLYPALLGQFDACLYVGRDSREYYRHYRVSDRKLFFAPHCVDNEFFASRARSLTQAQARDAMGLAAGRAPVILFVGKLIDVKRPLDLVAAAAVLNAGRQPVQLLYVGDGPLHAKIAERARELRVEVHLPGFRNQSELPAALRAADVLVLPSESETWGLTVNEAMACGIPAVVSDTVGCGPDLVRPDSVYPMGDTSALAKTLLATLATPPSPASLQSTIDRYSVVATAQGIVDAAQSIAHQAGEQA